MEMGEGGGWRDVCRLVAWGLYALAGVCVVVFGFIAAWALVMVGVSFVVSDALFTRRVPWLSVPATVALGLLFGWGVYLQVKERRELAAKVRAQVLACPGCGGPLPPWDGVFLDNPHEPACVDWVGIPPRSFRLRCDRCRHEAWFSVDHDGRVTDASWSWFDAELSRLSSPPGGVIDNLDEVEGGEDRRPTAPPPEGPRPAEGGHDSGEM